MAEGSSTPIESPCVAFAATKSIARIRDWLTNGHSAKYEPDLTISVDEFIAEITEEIAEEITAEIRREAPFLKRSLA
jgi:hypothetical protein